MRPDGSAECRGMGYDWKAAAAWAAQRDGMNRAVALRTGGHGPGCGRGGICDGGTGPAVANDVPAARVIPGRRLSPMGPFSA
ncbi:hypothetical protein B0B51_07125 [blood disease bacterium A2-HR MARDI]|uniref:Uncharacterized protein n=1 Tax=blood disease bacterium A2-HR MARDI TaxID=1944648 RepID=A0A1U9VGH8_9RALS|nr:hypothetical protein B0B51_07125 [blood disease bacterium A2-HR MARDI]